MNFHEYLEGNLSGGPQESPMAGTHYIEMPIFAEGEVGEIQKAIFAAMSFNVHRVFDGKVHYLFPRAVDVGYVRQVIRGVTMYLHGRMVDSGNDAMINRELGKSAEIFNSIRPKDWYKDWYRLETEKLADAVLKKTNNNDTGSAL